MKCDKCKQETEITYDLVLFHCGLRYELCKKCYYKALGKSEETDNRDDNNSDDKGKN